VGFWVEKMKGNRNTYDYNLLNGANNYDQKPVPGTSLAGAVNNVVYDQSLSWLQYQPFAEFEWAVNDKLVVTPGIKYVHHSLKMDALVNQGDRLNQNISKDFQATLPFLTANYKLSADWAAYAQYAQGMLVPNITSYYTSGANTTSITPQRSTNYQVGAIHKTNTIVFDTDIYYINFDNKIATVPGTTGNNAVFFNQGGVVYKGAEAALTYSFDSGLSTYTNFSLNRATSKTTGLTIAGVPNNTGALGLLYKQGGWSASLIDKLVGSTYALEGAYKVDAYSSLDLNTGYTFKNPGLGAKSLKASLGIYNVLNHQDILSAAPKVTTLGAAGYGAVNAADTFTYQPARSFMVSVKADF
jgi:iron complex outermembrane receptor protein